MPTTTVAIDRSTCPKKKGKHGTAGTYKLGCRCPDAASARRRYNKRRDAGLLPVASIPGIGIARRLQALSALGHTDTVVGPAMGLKGKHGGVSWYRCRPDALFHRETYLAVVRAYDQLSMTPGTSLITRRRALGRGYAPPLAWEGVDIDDPAAVPDLGKPTERRAGWEVLDMDDLARTYLAGRSLDELSVATGRKVATLHMYLAEHGVALPPLTQLQDRPCKAAA